jgi:hypothetical protein
MKLRNLNNLLLAVVAAAPMMASAFDIGEQGITVADAKLYSQIGYDSTGRYEYLNGRAQDSFVEVSGKSATKNVVKQSGKHVEKQVTGKHKTAKKKESWGAIAGREARLERERLERTGEEFDWRKYM